MTNTTYEPSVQEFLSLARTGSEEEGLAYLRSHFENEDGSVKEKELLEFTEKAMTEARIEMEAKLEETKVAEATEVQEMTEETKEAVAVIADESIARVAEDAETNATEVSEA